MRVKALIRLTGSAEPEHAEPIWQKAAEQADGATDLLDWGLAARAIIQGRIKADDGDRALEFVGTLKGDRQAYAIWLAADEMAQMENGAPREWLDRLFTLAEAAQFDHYPKKSRVYARLAEAQARAGDEMAAEKTVGLLDTSNSIRHSRYTHARVDMLVESARTKIRTGRNDEALVTLTVVEDIIEPYQGDDGGQSFPIGRIAELLAEAGNVPAARMFLDEIQSARLHVSTLCRIAVIQSKAGDREGAKSTMKAALAALEDLSSEMLWDTSGTNLDGPYIGYGRQQVLGEIAVAQAKIGEYDEALKTLDSARTKDALASPFGDTDEILEIANLRLESGDFDGARAMIESVEKDTAGFKIAALQSSLAAIAQAQAKSGALEKTLAWIEALKSPRVKLRCLAGYGKGIAERLAAGKK
jgi:tetratricopeptide (TPR) repeat protein